MEDSTAGVPQLPTWLQAVILAIVSGSIILVNAAVLLILYIGSTVDLPFQQRISIIEPLNIRTLLVLLSSVPAVIALSTNPNRKITWLLMSVFGVSWIIWLQFILSF